MPIDSSYAKVFLKDYFLKTQESYVKYLNKEILESKEFGEIPTQLLLDYKNIAQSGKRVRGALIVLAYLAFGGKDLENIYDTSLFIEIYHTALLIQDDFMDQDNIRRGVPTLHSLYEQKAKQLEVKMPANLYGVSSAIIAGDFAFYSAWEKLLKSNFPAEYKIEAGKILTHYSKRVGLGQMLDLTITGAKEIKEEDILNVIWTKSGEYTTLLPLKIGAALAGFHNEQQLKALENYAKCLGWAFHIQDDLLGMFANEEELGKPVGSDLREGKNTLLMMNLEKLGTKEHTELKSRLLGNPNITNKDVEEMRNALRESGSYDYVLNLGNKYVDEGKSYISQITTDLELQKIFESLLIFMIERTK